MLEGDGHRGRVAFAELVSKFTARRKGPGEGNAE